MTAAHKRLEKWVTAQLASPAQRGGRNNQIIQVAPRMLELGWDEDGIVEAFMTAFEYGDEDADKEAEIRAAVASAGRYVQPIDERSKKEVMEAKARASQAQAVATRLFKRVMTDFRWTYDEIEHYGGCKDLHPLHQTREFLERLFVPEDVVWIGPVFASGKPRHAANFKTAAHWTVQSRWPGEFVSHCTFQPGVCSRSNDTMAEHKYMVVESDELGLDEVGAVFNWLSAECGAKLRAVVYSGKKSLHGWFDWPQQTNADAEEHLKIEDVKATLVGLRCDPSTLRPSQPVRLPGVRRKDTGKIQSLLYLA